MATTKFELNSTFDGVRGAVLEFLLDADRVVMTIHQPSKRLVSVLRNSYLLKTQITFEVHMQAIELAPSPGYVTAMQFADSKIGRVMRVHISNSLEDSTLKNSTLPIADEQLDSDDQIDAISPPSRSTSETES